MADQVKKRILLIDDEEGIRFTFNKFLSEAGYDVDIVKDFDCALKCINGSDFDVILCDIVLPGGSGIDILKEVKKKNTNCPVIMMTGYPSIDSVAEAFRIGAFDYLQKPIKKDGLLQAIGVALQHTIVDKDTLHSNDFWKLPKKVVVLTAHPDDEVLGCGGFISQLRKNKSDVSVIFTSDGIRHAPVSTDSKEDAYVSLGLLGLQRENIHFLGVKTQRSEEYALRDFTPLVESLGANADLVITNSEHDLNVDHIFAYKLAMTCFRPIKYRTKIMSMEILSSSEYSPHLFQPNYYVDISESLDVKLQALSAYQKQVLPFPHPRSAEALRIKGQQRGLEVGFLCAEAFRIMRWF